jgi:hypothetical protein
MAARLPIKAKPPKDGDAESERLKSASTHVVLLIKTDRPSETQNQENLMTQSHGSKITTLLCDHDRQAAEEQIFSQG